MGGMAGMGGGMGFPPGGAGGGANPGGGIGGPGGFPGAGGPTPGAAGPQGGAFPGGGPGGFQGGRGFPAAEPQRLGDFHIHPLKHIRAGSVVQIVNQLYGPARGGPRLAADDASNSLIVAGTEQQVHDVLKLVTRLEEVSKEAVEDRTKRQAKE
jgi:hypothetical protein